MSDTLNKLYDVLDERRSADPKSSYVASLYGKGTGFICEKVVEETQETIVEAVNGDQGRLKEESADLLFHLMVLWADQGVTPDDVLQILENRFGISGHEEKASRDS